MQNSFLSVLMYHLARVTSSGDITEWNKLFKPFY